MDKSTLTKKELAGLTESVELYLKDFIARKRESIIRAIANCEPDLSKLLQFQAQLKAIMSLSQELSLDKMKAEEE